MKLLFCPQLCTLPPGLSLLLSVLSLRRAVNRLGLSYPGQGFSLPEGVSILPAPLRFLQKQLCASPGLPRRQTAFETSVCLLPEALRCGTSGKEAEL